MKFSPEFHNKAAECRMDAHLLRRSMDKKNEDTIKQMVAILKQAAEVYDQLARAVDRK